MRGSKWVRRWIPVLTPVILAAIAFYAVSQSSKLVDITEEQMRLKLRPFIGVNKVKTDRDREKDELKFSLEVKNAGDVTGVISYYFLKVSLDGQELYTMPVSTHLVLLPGQVISLSPGKAGNVKEGIEKARKELSCETKIKYSDVVSLRSYLYTTKATYDIGENIWHPLFSKEIALD